jgi:DNA invertase Pin-like site-specific DNA recombinase
MNDKPLVAYYRVSTAQQKRSGLGLLAQRESVRLYIEANPGRLIAELTEIESGRNANRPKLAEALWLCRVHDAKLVVARLDRLARNVALVSRLMETSVDFVAADMPMANRFTLHIIAAVAEYESRLISQRIKAAYAVAIKQGRKFGGSRGVPAFSPAALRARAQAETERATTRALNFAPLLCALRDLGESVTGIARQLTLMEIETPRGRSQWTYEQVRRMFIYAGERLPRRHANYRSQAERRATMLRFPIVRLD